MISEKLKELREKSGMTQKDLSEKLFVSPQAVSRWENGDTEPSATTLKSIAEIFGVSLDELFGYEAPQPEVIVQKETVYTAAPAVLGVCENCKKAITDSADYVVNHHYSGHNRISTCRCRECDDRIKKTMHQQEIEYGLKCRKRAYIWSAIIAVALLLLSLGVTLSDEPTAPQIVGSVIVSLLFFPFMSCVFLKNNFVGDMFLAVSSFGFVKFPGLIFSLDLDGIVWLLTVKLAF